MRRKPGASIAKALAQWWVSRRRGSVAVLEQQIGETIPDVIVIEKRGRVRPSMDLIAFEVKSSHDRLVRAVKQCGSYLRWADYTYAVAECGETETTFAKCEALFGSFTHVGVILAGKDFTIRCRPARNFPSFSDLEWAAKKEFMVRELKHLGFPVSITQPKNEIVRTLRQVENKKEILRASIIATILSRFQALRYKCRSFPSTPEFSEQSRLDWFLTKTASQAG